MELIGGVLLVTLVLNGCGRLGFGSAEGEQDASETRDAGLDAFVSSIDASTSDATPIDGGRSEDAATDGDMPRDAGSTDAATSDAMPDAGRAIVGRAMPRRRMRLFAPSAGLRSSPRPVRLRFENSS